MMQNDNITWDRIYAEIDAILNGGGPEYHEKSKQEKGSRKARIIRSNWGPDDLNDDTEAYTTPSEIPAQPILKASARDRRHMFR